MWRWWPCMQQGNWSLMILEVSSNPSHSIILWFQAADQSGSLTSCRGFEWMGFKVFSKWSHPTILMKSTAFKVIFYINRVKTMLWGNNRWNRSEKYTHSLSPFEEKILLDFNTFDLIINLWSFSLVSKHYNKLQLFQWCLTFWSNISFYFLL